MRITSMASNMIQHDLKLVVTVKDAASRDVLEAVHQTQVYKGLQVLRAGRVLQQAQSISILGVSELFEVWGHCPGEGIQVNSASPTSLKVGAVTATRDNFHSFSLRRIGPKQTLYMNSYVSISCAPTGQLIRLEIKMLDDGETSVDHLWQHAQSWWEQNQPSLVLAATVLAIFVGLWFLSQTKQSSARPLNMASPATNLPVNSPVPRAVFSPNADSPIRPTPRRYDVRSASGNFSGGLQATPGYTPDASPLQRVFSDRGRRA
jgi:hypothetical protein